MPKFGTSFHSVQGTLSEGMGFGKVLVSIGMLHCDPARGAAILDRARGDRQLTDLSPPLPCPVSGQGDESESI